MASDEFKNRSGDTVAKEKKELITELRSRTQQLKENLLELEMFQIEQYEVHLAS